MLLIGLTPALDREAGRVFVNGDYLNAVQRAGALPAVLPMTEERAVLDAVLNRVDGLIFTGGGDLEPACYGEARLPECGESDPVRDRMEWYLMARALEKDVPILAICRGLQVLNCLLGGTLYQDLPSQLPGQVIHPQYDLPRDAVHTLQVAEGGLLSRITGQTELGVNSRHHQGIKKLAAGLRPCAAAADGLIEAAELPGKRFVLGVQWHPESISEKHPEQQALFNAFTEACKG